MNKKHYLKELTIKETLQKGAKGKDVQKVPFLYIHIYPSNELEPVFLINNANQGYKKKQI